MSERRRLFKETRDRKINTETHDIEGNELKPIGKFIFGADSVLVAGYGYRSFDRHFSALDARFGDYLRQPLIASLGPKQVFFSSLLTRSLGNGQALIAVSAIPDMDHFRGSFGAKNVIPLYRDSAAKQPNVTVGLLNFLSTAYGVTLIAEDLAAYVYAALGGQSYTSRFWNELETPGPRIPLTRDSKTFAEAAALGRRLLWLHTYAERFRSEGRGDELPSGSAKCLKGVSIDPERYPQGFAYDPAKREVRVGDGVFGPVVPDVWEFQVSGLKVVQSWLGYRMKKRAGKKSSPLDDIRPERWTPRMTEELLELLWVLEATLAMEPELSAMLDRIVAGPCLKASELPMPTAEERKAPGAAGAVGELLGLMEDEEAPEEDEDD